MQVKREQVRRFMEQSIPFNRYLGMSVSELEDGRARIDIPFREEFIGDPGRPALHGGVISALVDTCGGAAVWTTIETSDRLSTVDLRVDYLRPGPAKDISCIAEVVRMGNRVGVADMRVFPMDDPDLIVATGKAVYSVKRAE
jgi:uncharacterized protein (TIGR00369 family)